MWKRILDFSNKEINTKCLPSDEQRVVLHLLDVNNIDDTYHKVHHDHICTIHHTDNKLHHHE